MMSAVDEFLHFWARFEDRGFLPENVHPADASLVRQGDFELSLLPMPINGSLSEAEAIILMLNPGLESDDGIWENSNPDFRGSLLDNLSQRHEPGGYPLLYLNPSFDLHPGPHIGLEAPL